MTYDVDRPINKELSPCEVGPCPNFSKCQGKSSIDSEGNKYYPKGLACRDFILYVISIDDPIAMKEYLKITPFTTKWKHRKPTRLLYETKMSDIEAPTGRPMKSTDTAYYRRKMGTNRPRGRPKK